ncbi:DUF1152 domain-containing protein [Thermoleophilum album]|uniref:DUF1152 domain-containing protein n=1 Tax=Thermoleophilum album TaxID=29539 RepID=A0A1H6FHT5_THEAL|nr:DUF1152 domain-containing protein [Thermoleophilum album]SEH10399.1 hypothetical protein SAMN02745716_0248 [Thermoleophilum album]
MTASQVPAAALDVESLATRSRRPLVLGVGGGGDVVGAAAVAALFEPGGAQPLVGGTSWERRVVDPRPGPRSADEIEGALAHPARSLLVAGPDTRISEHGARFAEAVVAEELGSPTVIVDVTCSPRRIADDLAAAASSLGFDSLVLLDVGGDAVARGDERGLASPLCDALLLAAGALVAEERRLAVLGGVFGAGCDGELTPWQVLDRLAALARVGAMSGARGLTPAAAERLQRLCTAVPTEASAQALACFHGASGTAPIRDGLRTVERTPLGSLCFFFDPLRALAAGELPLAAAVIDASGLEEANRALLRLGVRTELEFERARAREAAS